MSSILLNRGNEFFCAVKPAHSSYYFLYKLERFEEHGFQFYGINHKFEFTLKLDMPISEQPYGFLGSGIDLSGRKTNINLQRNTSKNNIPERKIITLDTPIYSLIGKKDDNQLAEIIEKYNLEKSTEKDFPYANISISCSGVSGAGDDLYLNTLFFMTKGYGILTEISAIAGRDIEDCCSPEFYYKAYKVKLNLNDSNPLKRVKAENMFYDSLPADWTISTNPEIIKPAKVKFDDHSEKIKDLDKLTDELLRTFMRKK